MVSKPTGKDQTESMLNTQKELFDAYEHASHLWLTRVKSELDLWSELATRLAATRSAPEAIVVCQESVAQRVRMAAEDGQRLIDEWQEITGIVTRSLSEGRPTAST
jgi:putative heme degradation protein